MTELTRQFDLLAQGPNFEDLLILVVMLVLWLGGALVKVISSARKGRPRQQGPQEVPASRQDRPHETWQEKLARKAGEMQKAMEAKAGQMEHQARARGQAQGARPTQPSAPPAGRITVRPGPKGDSVMVYERPPSQHATRQREITKAVGATGRQMAKSPPVEPRVERAGPGSEPIVEAMTGVMREPPRPLDMESTRSGMARQSTGFEPATLIDYSDPDALRKAILHYEILGRPIALRDPSGETDSF